jgi:hypothetical protein
VSQSMLKRLAAQGARLYTQAQVDQMIAKAVLIESEAMLPHPFGSCADGQGPNMCRACDRVAANCAAANRAAVDALKGGSGGKQRS